ncbi:MAG: triosephosphate isomerase [Bacilli bacterium]|nr:triosephosphate isomerase [Bacilli bacterium]
MIVALNNKSNFTREEYKEYLKEIEKIYFRGKLILCPTYLNLTVETDVLLGAQDVSPFEDGAHTGEISAKQLSSIGVKYSIVGHSERRLNETEEELFNEIKRLLENNMTPILCIGERKVDREKGSTKAVIGNQLSSVVNYLTENERSNVIIAYEPVWAIGTGEIPTNDEIQEVISFIKSKLPNNKVLYGGSANEENIDELKKIEGIDGYLVGGLSLKPDKLQIFLDKLRQEE